MATAAQRDDRRPVVAVAEHPAFQRKRWDEPLEPPKSSVCLRCHRDVPYLVWRPPDWVCAVCAEAS